MQGTATDKITSRTILAGWIGLAGTVGIFGFAIIVSHVFSTRLGHASGFLLVGAGVAIVLLATLRYVSIKLSIRESVKHEPYRFRSDSLLVGLITLLFGAFGVLLWAAS
jgi:hypothetical protein